MSAIASPLPGLFLIGITTMLNESPDFVCLMTVIRIVASRPVNLEICYYIL